MNDKRMSTDEFYKALEVEFPEIYDRMVRTTRWFDWRTFQEIIDLYPDDVLYADVLYVDVLYVDILDHIRDNIDIIRFRLL